jgi:hypothetical protein
MNVFKCLSVASLFFILGNVLIASADTGIDGTATASSSFTLSGLVSISSLTASSIVVSTLTVNNQIIANIKNSSLTLQGLTVDSITINSQQSGILLGALQQIVVSSVTGSTATNSTTFVDTNLSVTIAPKFSTDKIKLMACGPLYNGGVGNMFTFLTFSNGTTNLMGSNGGAKCLTELGGDLICQACLIFIDSPGTISSVTYKLRFKQAGGGASNVTFCQDGNVTCVMTAEDYK